jgi:Tfp pilus assembly protein PilP
MIVFLVVLSGCEGKLIDIKERPTMPEVKEPAKPNYAKYEALEKEIEQAFDEGKVPLNYVAQKNPFSSAIEEYLASLRKSDVDNPLLIPLEQIKLVGIMNSETGKVGVVEALNQVFFVRVGDKIGNADGVIIDITKTAILVRETRKDIFGEFHTTVKELKLIREEKS